MTRMEKGLSQRYLLWLQLSQGFVIQLGFAVFFPFLRQHFTFAELSLQSAVQYSVPFLLLPFIRVFWVRRFVIIAMLISLARLFFAANIHSHAQLYLAALMAGCVLVLFWVPYEITYFKTSSKHGNTSAWYFAITSLVSTLAPLTAGVIADTFGYAFLFRLAACLMAIPLLLAWRLPKEPVHETFSASLRATRGIQHLLFFDGFFLSIGGCLLSLALLTFTKTATAFGAVGGLAALVATLVSFVAANMSDRTHNRFAWIASTSVLSAIVLLILGWQQSFWWFSFFLVMFTCIRTLVQPIMNALPMDLQADRTKLYIARQFFLNVGRVLGFGLTWICALTYGLKPMYIVYALGFLVYIFYVRKTLRTSSLA